MKSQQRHRKQTRFGFTLIDTVLSLAVVAMMVLVYAGLAGVRGMNRRVADRAQAGALADEELNALKRMKVSTLANQTNRPFIGVLYNAGDWRMANDTGNLDTVSSPCPPPTSGKHCGPNVVELVGATGFANAVSGRLLFPAGAYTDAVLQASWKVNSDSPSGWAVGYLFRSQDAANGYRLRVAAVTTDLDPDTSGTQNFVLDRLVGGARTVLFSKANVTFASNTWYSLKVELSGGSIKTYLNGTEQDSGSINDTTFTAGSAALLGWGGVHANVDDVMTVTTETKRWDFEGGSSLPAAWVRLSLNDLPDGAATVFDDNGSLTLAPYPNTNSTNLKKATITIRWLRNGNQVSYTTAGLIGNSALGQ